MSDDNYSDGPFSDADIFSLPMCADKLLPQKDSMQLIDSLTRIEGDENECEMTVKSDNIFLYENGTLSESIYLELMAQTIASSLGYATLCEGKKIGTGFLVGAKKLKIRGQAEIGDRLTIITSKEAEFGNFGIIKGAVYKNKTIIADGELKVWVTEAE